MIVNKKNSSANIVFYLTFRIARSVEDLWSTDWGSLSPEYVNFCVALVAVALSYARVLWSASKSLALLISLANMAGAVLLAIAYAGFGVLYKVHSH